MQEKAYKLLAIQEGITNRSAKDLIDRGVVYSGGKKVVMARALMNAKTKFRVERIQKMRVIFEDEKLIAIDKPAFITSEQIAKKFHTPLLHRLDKETSGVLLLVKDEAFQKKAIEAFRTHQVEKIYHAWVSGVIAEPLEIDTPLVTHKKSNRAYTKVARDGLEAHTRIEPLIIEGKYTKVKATILTGRTHQIRVHLKSVGFPIVGDTQYGTKSHKRLLLHAHEIALLGYRFTSKEPRDFHL